MAKGSSNWAWYLLAVFIGGGLFAAVLLSMSLFGGEGVAGVNYSIFTVISDADDEDVSNFCEIDILVPDDDHTFDEWSDLFSTSNFDTEISGDNAEDVAIDLTQFVLDEDTDPYGYWGWVIVNEDSDGYDLTLDFNETAFMIDLSSNNDYTIRVYQTPTNVKFSMMCEETDMMGLPFGGTITMTGGVGIGDTGVCGGQDGNYTITIDSFEEYGDVHGTAPSSDQTAGMHYGSGYEVSTTDFADLSAHQQEWYYDESNQRSLGGLYTIANDTAETYNSYLSKHTVVYAICFEMNISIGSTADYDDFNLTASDDNEVDTTLLTNGNEAFMIFLDTVHVGDRFDLEMQFGTDINCTDIRCCQLYMGDVDATGLVDTEFPFDIDYMFDAT